MKTAIHRNRWFGRGVGAITALSLAAVTFLAWPGASAAPVAHAQSPSCASAEFSANAEGSTGIAFVDVGVGKTATFVCITSTAFTGGESAPITANGAQNAGCYFVEGIGTSVVSVFTERPDVKPGCAAITRIRVGTSVQSTPTATPTTPAATPTTTQPAATATPTRAATQPPATATQPPAATPTAVVAPRPPATGTGAGGDNSLALLPLFLGLGIIAAGLGAVAIASSRKRTR